MQTTWWISGEQSKSGEEMQRKFTLNTSQQLFTIFTTVFRMTLIIMMLRCENENYFVALDKFMIWIYPWNIDTSYRFNQLGYFINDRQNFTGQLGGANFSGAGRHHGDLFSLRQRRGDFSGDLEWVYSNVENSNFASKKSSLFTFGSVSRSISTIAASRYSLHASAFFDICSALQRKKISMMINVRNQNNFIEQYFFKCRHFVKIIITMWWIWWVYWFERVCQ